MTYDEFKSKYQISLNDQQERAVQAVNGYVLLLAVPGSGKTTVLVTRLGYLLLCRGVPPEHILTTTYTVAATGDMRRRFASLFGKELADKLEFRTINGVSARIIQYYERVHDAHAFSLCTDEKALTTLVREICRRAWNDYPTEGDIKGIRSAITYVKNMMCKPEEAVEVCREIEAFEQIYDAYNRTLRKRRLMDYDDQMVYAHQILLQYPKIREAFQKQYRYICVDEAQDTSKIQHAIIELLSAGGGNLFMVGDEDQSIYGFRAAYPRALLNFEKEYPGAKILLMEKNYRSTRQIVEAADRFVQKNRNRHPKHMSSVRGEGGPVRNIPLYNRREQYTYLVKTAQSCRQETAVLYRDNDSALPLIDLLQRKGIPFRCRQMDATFFSNRVVRDITDVIRLARDPMDDALFMRLYYKFCAGISKSAAENAVHRHDKKTSALSLLAADGSLSSWAREQCKELQTHMTHLLEERADKAVYRIVHDMGYGQYLEKYEIDTSRAEILQALGEQEATPGGLLDRLAVLQEFLRAHKTDTDCPFILSTIHSSKGLEYERVFLMDVIDGLFPKPDGDGNNMPEEERRLFYVGMTRAKDRLTVFTFRNLSAGSSFAEELFPTKTPTPQPFTPAPKPNRRSAASVKMKIPADIVRQMADQRISGRAVVHDQFGRGKIIHRDDEIIAIRFNSGDIRRFALFPALQMGVLRPKQS